MFLFSCLTGLRWSDIEKLKWSELLEEQGEPDKKIFTGLKYGNWNKTHIKDWMTEAGITKKITFHCARHTYATLQLSLGTDIYTVSKLLGQ